MSASAPVYRSAPPGTVMQDVPAYLRGEGMGLAWHVVASRKQVGLQNGKDPAYQWWVSFYAPVNPGSNQYQLKYRIPGNSELVPTVTKAHGAQLYFPMETVKIVGAAELERTGIQDVVLATHSSAADCGGASVTVFGVNAHTGAVEPRVDVNNGCELNAAIVSHGKLHAVALTGPYYGPKAALCCPTKNNASALLYQAGSKWVVTPSYFSIAPRPAVQH